MKSFKLLKNTFLLMKTTKTNNNNNYKKNNYFNLNNNSCNRHSQFLLLNLKKINCKKILHAKKFLLKKR